MTLKQILECAMAQLGRDVDRRRMISCINGVMIDLARDLRPTRTDCVRKCAWVLPRVPVEVLKVTQGDVLAAVTYVYVPRLLRFDDDVPDLPEWCHGALATFAVRRYRGEVAA